MNLHDADLKAKLTRFLGRKSAPRLFDTNAQAQADEIGALFAAIKRVAPRDPDQLPSWWNEFEPTLSAACGRIWPTEKEIAAAGKAVSENLRPAYAPERKDEHKIDPAENAARKMARGEPVGENWLYGVSACELIARGLVDEGTMQRYRSAAYFARVNATSEDQARRWESEAKERHEEGRVLWKARENKRTKRTLPIPDKTAPTASMEGW